MSVSPLGDDLLCAGIMIYSSFCPMHLSQYWALLDTHRPLVTFRYLFPIAHLQFPIYQYMLPNGDVPINNGDIVILYTL